MGPTGRTGAARSDGALVPWGIHDLGFNGRKGPWRAGANENTVLTVSHPVLVQGQPLPAGSVRACTCWPGHTEWTVIFSKNSTSWGSFSYDEKEDQLRVTVTPEKTPYREWLSYEFLDRKPDRATVALDWEELRVPFTIVVPDMASLYVANLRNELRNAPGFSWQNWQAAAQDRVQANVNLAEALTWAENAISLPGIGVPSFSTYMTKAQVLEKLSRNAERRQGDDRRDGPAQRPAGGDPPVRPPAPRPGQTGRGDGGLPEERRPVRRRMAHARRAGARLFGRRRLQAGARACGEGARTGAGSAEQEEPRRRGRQAEGGPRHERHALDDTGGQT